MNQNLKLIQDGFTPFYSLTVSSPKSTWICDACLKSIDFKCVWHNKETKEEKSICMSCNDKMLINIHKKDSFALFLIQGKQEQLREEKTKSQRELLAKNTCLMMLSDLETTLNAWLPIFNENGNS